MNVYIIYIFIKIYLIFNRKKKTFFIIIKMSEISANQQKILQKQGELEELLNKVLNGQKKNKASFFSRTFSSFTGSILNSIIILGGLGLGGKFVYDMLNKEGGALKDLKNDMDKVLKDIESVIDKDNQDSIVSKVDDVTKNVDDVTNDVGNIKEKVDSITDKVDGVTNDIANVQTTVNAINTKVQTLS